MTPTAPGYPPDGSAGCRLCGGTLLTGWLETGLGERFCVAHRWEPPCGLCSAPVPTADPQPPFCGPCGATAVTDRAGLRQRLPEVRTVLHGLGIRLDPPARIRIADAVEAVPGLRVRPAGPGRLHGLAEVDATGAAVITILAGLPVMLFGAVVAHESMHVWLAQHGFPTLDPQVEEGLCELASFGWLRRQGDPRAALVRAAVERSPDPVYGDGFRAARAAARERGVRDVLKHVRTHGRLP